MLAKWGILSKLRFCWTPFLVLVLVLVLALPQPVPPPPAADLDADEVLGLEVVGRAAAPVHDVLVLALAAQLAVPVGEAQVVVHHALTVDAVLQHRVEERLGERHRDRERDREREREREILHKYYNYDPKGNVHF